MGSGDHGRQGTDKKGRGRNRSKKEKNKPEPNPNGRLKSPKITQRRKLKRGKFQKEFYKYNAKHKLRMKHLKVNIPK